MVEYKSLRENSTRIIERQTGRQTEIDRQTGRQTQTDRQTDRQTDERDRHIQYIET